MFLSTASKATLKYVKAAKKDFYFTFHQDFCLILLPPPKGKLP